jgi:hypothetical protein
MILFGLIIFSTCSGSAFGGIKKSASGVLRDIRISSETAALRVDITCSQPFSIHHFTLKSPDRIVIDFNNVNAIKALPIYKVKSHGVIRIRTGQFRPSTARVVIDLERAIPEHTSLESDTGLTLFIRYMTPPEPEIKKPEIESPPIHSPQKEMEKEKLEDLADEISKLRETTQSIKEQVSRDSQVLEDLKKNQDLRNKGYVRIVALGCGFFPHEGFLKETYGAGMMEGAELNIGLRGMFEAWAGLKIFTKKTISDSGQTAGKIRLIPIETGIKLRFNKGVINPYLGAGISFNQYREETPSGVKRESKTGILGLSGLFFKFAQYLTFDLYAHYRSCRLTLNGEEFEIGGWHFGAGFGFEF